MDKAQEANRTNVIMRPSPESNPGNTQEGRRRITHNPEYQGYVYYSTDALPSGKGLQSQGLPQPDRKEV